MGRPVEKRPSLGAMQKIAPRSERVIDISYLDETYIQIFFVFREEVVEAFRYYSESDRFDRLFFKKTPYSANFIKQCDICSIRFDGTLLDYSFVFAHESHVPFAMYYRNKILTKNDIAFKDLMLKNIPCEKFQDDDRTGTVLGTGDCSLELKEDNCVLTATNPVFTVAVKQHTLLIILLTIVLWQYKERQVKQVNCSFIQPGRLTPANYKRGLKDISEGFCCYGI